MCGLTTSKYYFLLFCWNWLGYKAVLQIPIKAFTLKSHLTCSAFEIHNKTLHYIKTLVQLIWRILIQDYQEVFYSCFNIILKIWYQYFFALLRRSIFVLFFNSTGLLFGISTWETVLDDLQPCLVHKNCLSPVQKL